MARSWHRRPPRQQSHLPASSGPKGTVMRALLVVLTIGGALLVGGCGPASGGGTVHAALKENGITLDQSTASAGTVVFDVKNAGTIVHEFVVIKTDVAPDKLPASAGEPGQMLEDGSVGEVEDVNVGESKQLSIKLEPGKYVLICNLAGHYALGMHVGFVVK
jgi:uncharacterized cupredoxin-like copper-binding protein